MWCEVKIISGPLLKNSFCPVSYPRQCVSTGTERGLCIMATGVQQPGSTGHQRALDQRVLVLAVSLSSHHVPLAFQLDAGVS